MTRAEAIKQILYAFEDCGGRWEAEAVACLRAVDVDQDEINQVLVEEFDHRIDDL
jgi:predicted metalloprotease